MSDTPETDAAWHEYISPPYTYGAGDLCILAERLERERDEAIRQRNETNESSKYAVDYAMRERDEAREQNAKLRDIADRAITAVALWAGSRTNSASELRAELDQLKEGAK